MVYEKRTFIKEEEKQKLIEYFDSHCSQKAIEKQVIYNYHTEGDFRLIKTKDYMKIDFKPSSALEKENTVFINPKYQQDLTEIYRKIGLDIEMKRFRIRHKYIYQGLYVSVDENVKTGNIFRIKFHYDKEQDLSIKKQMIKDIFNQFEIEETDLSKFQDLYAKYRMDWYDLTKEIDEEEFLK